MSYDYDLLIIGGGSAGLSLASGAAQLGVKVLLVSKDKLGGDCLHFGCVPSKTLLASAKVAKQVKRAEHFGVSAVFEGADWNRVTNRIQDIQAVIQKHDSPERFRKLGCDVVFGVAKFTDPHTVEVAPTAELALLQDSQLIQDTPVSFSAKKLVIATGSRPSIPPIDGIDSVDYITNETLFTLKQQPKNLLIIGGGVIAVEIAQAMSRLGTNVTIAVRGEHLLKNEDSDVQAVIEKSLMRDGVTLLFGIVMNRVSKIESGIEFSYTKDDSAQVDKFDTVFLATGRTANTELNLEATGVTYDKHIPVDRKMRTNVRHILAIGDVNGTAQFTHAANYEAGIVLSNEVLHIPAKANYNSIGWTLFTDPEVASIGLNEKQATEAGVGFTVVQPTFETQDRALTESTTDGFIKILIDRKTRILGVQIVAPRAGEMIREWQLAISKKMKLSTIARSTFIYPTYGELSKWAAGSHYAPKLFSPFVKKVLRFLFGYRGSCAK